MKLNLKDLEKYLFPIKRIFSKYKQIKTVEQVKVFIQEQSAQVSQMTLYGYLSMLRKILLTKKGRKDMSNKESHWQKTKNHMFVTLAIWFFFSIVIFMFGESVNQGSFLGYPLAYYMSAQGSLAAFVILIFWFANKQEKIDDEHGYGGEREDD